MLNKLTTLSLLLGSTQAAYTKTVTITSAAGVTPFVASNYPAYDPGTTLADANSSLNNNGYACIRKGYNYIFPATSSTNAIGTGLTQTFYPTTLAKLGTVGIAADNSSGCCPSGAALANGNCAIAITAGGTKIALRVGYGPNADATSVDGFNFNTDFLLASTYQDSWDGTPGTRAAAPANYCDVQVSTAINIYDRITRETT